MWEGSCKRKRSVEMKKQEGEDLSVSKFSEARCLGSRRQIGPARHERKISSGDREGDVRRGVTFEIAS